jgi:hypothetical protein
MGSKSGLFGVLFCWLKYSMDYKLYTLVDITHTGQNRNEPGKELARLEEQNFQTVLQTLGIRANIDYTNFPTVLETTGRNAGFDTDEILRLWRFDFSTERDSLYGTDQDPVEFLKQDFHLVPYIGGLNEDMEQQYAVFNTADPGKNISFFVR